MKALKTKKTMVINLKGGHIPLKLDNPDQHFEEIKRGTGVIQPEKGKGSYSRKKTKKKIRFTNHFE